MKFIRPCLVALLLLHSGASVLRAQQLAVGVGYGAQSSVPHPRAVVAQAAVGIRGDPRDAFLVAPAVTMAMRDGRTGWRAHIALENRFRWTILAPYFGAGPSWTSEVAEADWSGGEWGMVLVTGVDVAVRQLTTGGLTLAAFAEWDSYTYDYARGQVLVGLRLMGAP